MLTASPRSAAAARSRRHHAGEQAAAAVRRRHRDHRDPVGGDRPAARHGQLERHAAQAADRAAAVERAPGALQVGLDLVEPERRHRRVPAGRCEEGGVDGAQEVGGVLGLGVADLDGHAPTLARPARPIYVPAG